MTSSKSTASHHGTAVTIPRPFAAYRGSDPYVFVSYSHADAEEVFAEIAFLRDRGYRIWYDEGMEPGTMIWQQTIVERIEACAFALGYLSPTATGSEYVVKEILLALQERKQLVTIHLRETALPSSLKLNLVAAQAIMKYEYREPEYLERLLKTLPESAVETKPPIGPEQDFKAEIEFRLRKALGWSRELADELTRFGELLGLDPERVKAVLVESLQALGIDADYDSRLEQVRKLAATLVATGEISAERRRILVNRGEALRIPPAHWESVVQQEATRRARELIAAGARAEASQLLVSAVGEVVSQSAEIRALLEELEQGTPGLTVADEVVCTVFAPPSVAISEPFLLQVFAHVKEDASEAASLATASDPEASPRSLRTLDTEVPQGSRLGFELTIPGCTIDEPMASLVWNGYPEGVQFGVTVPAGAHPGALIGKVVVSLEEVPIGHLKFKLQAVRGSASQASEPVSDPMKRFTTAFISYASPDRDQVLSRVQMLRPLGIRFFQDLLELEPGSRWERELYRHIDECDLFLLFWSRSAKESPWVLKEVGYALERKRGDEFAPPEIIPIILEGPPIVPPPPELEHLHFNDRLLYFMSGSAGQPGRIQ